MANIGRPKKIQIDPEQPTWICYDCGMKHGSFKVGTATWHKDTCGVCGEIKTCTEPRDFGYLLLGWKEKYGRNAEETNEDSSKSS